jgi:Cu(I)/Ag(I) efflux system membrane fusion protein
MNRFLLLVAAALVAGTAGYVLGGRTAPPTAAVARDSGQAKAATTLWVCPMHSQIVQDHPGTCPICGMDLVEARTGEADAGHAAMHVDTATQQKMGIRLASAATTQLAEEIRTWGVVRFDGSSIYSVSPTVGGVITRLHAQWPGQRFAAGQVLYEIYSQDLLQTQYDYVDYLTRSRQTRASVQQTRERNRKALEGIAAKDQAAREQIERSVRQSTEQLDLLQQGTERDGVRLTNRLRLAGFTDAMLEHLGKTGKAFESLPVRATRPCLVKALGARTGDTVAPATEIVTCAGTATAWIDVALYPDQQPLVHEGDAVQITGLTPEPIAGRLSLPDPALDPVSRLQHGRVAIAVPIGSVRPEAVADVLVRARPRQGLSVPRSALVRTGHGDFVMLARGDGHFLPVPVSIGIEADDRVEITDGLQEGAQVVLNGSFLLDSAASFAASIERMNPPARSD